MRWCELYLSGSEQGQVVGSCDHGNDPSGSTECGKFLEQLRNYLYYLISQDSAGWCQLVCQSVNQPSIQLLKSYPQLYSYTEQYKFPLCLTAFLRYVSLLLLLSHLCLRLPYYLEFKKPIFGQNFFFSQARHMTRSSHTC